MKTHALVFSALLLGFTGCVGNNASVELGRICTHPKPDSTSGACLYPATCDVGQLDNQRVDLAASPGFENSYLWTPIQVSNQLPNNEDTTIGRLNTNDAFVEEARMSFQVPGASIPDMTFKMGPQLVPAGGSSVLIFPIVPVSAGAMITTTPVQIVVTLKAAGRFGDDSTFVTGEYKIPVEVCNGTGCAPGLPACTAPALPACCLQVGQTATCGCFTPS